MYHSVLADELPPLQGILKDHGWIVVHQPRSKDRRDACVGVRKSLTRPIDVEEAKRDYRQSVSASIEKAHFFLVLLGKRIDRCTLQRLALGSGNRRQIVTAFWTDGFPTFFTQLIIRPRCRRNIAAIRAEILALAIDRHGGRHDQLFYLRLRGQKLLQQDCGA